MTDITILLDRWKRGDRSVENDLAQLVYPELHSAARIQARRLSGALTLNPTELVHETYEKLHRQQRVDWRNRNHFFAIAATTMRRIAIDHVRARRADKRGGQDSAMALDELSDSNVPACPDMMDWLALDEALTDFARIQPDAAHIVELRIFAGLTKEQVADVTGWSRTTVGRQWRFARVWLAERLELPMPDERPQRPAA